MTKSNPVTAPMMTPDGTTYGASSDLNAPFATLPRGSIYVAYRGTQRRTGSLCLVAGVRSQWPYHFQRRYSAPRPNSHWSRISRCSLLRQCISLIGDGYQAAHLIAYFCVREAAKYDPRVGGNIEVALITEERVRLFSQDELAEVERASKEIAGWIARRFAAPGPPITGL